MTIVIYQALLYWALLQPAVELHGKKQIVLFRVLRLLKAFFLKKNEYFGFLRQFFKTNFELLPKKVFYLVSVDI